jgi:hypothetical protein
VKAVAEIIEEVVREYGSSRKAGLIEAARRICDLRGHVAPVGCEWCVAHHYERPMVKGRKVGVNRWCHDQGHANAKACRKCLAEVTNVADGSPEPQRLFEVA